MSFHGWGLVTLDLDGTLTTVHGWRFIAAALDRMPEYEATYVKFRTGAIGEDEHLANMLRIASGQRVERIQELLAETPKLLDIEPAIRRLRASGCRVALLTHNPPYVCEWYVREFGLDGYGGTSVAPPVGGVIPDPGVVSADKPKALQGLLRELWIPASEVVHVGDSSADARVFPLVGGGVAFNPDRDAVAAAADVVVRSRSLLDLLPVLQTLSPRALGAPPFERL
ncbi:MAG: haloacid dehalogenase-like hydrolase [Thermoplasmata archaeon]|nr:haloacid dehalogenase-like hydrolase [Thermoplasmata archaeon]MCI4341219.1 haloacid dehalogenase-like hydrolase [Thermoplasmata archaeon]